MIQKLRFAVNHGKIILPIVMCKKSTQNCKSRFKVILKNFLFCFSDEKLDLNDSKWEDIHVITGALKMFFRELPEPLFTFNHFNDFVNAISKYVITLNFFSTCWKSSVPIRPLHSVWSFLLNYFKGFFYFRNFKCDHQMSLCITKCQVLNYVTVFNFMHNLSLLWFSFFSFLFF